MKRADFLFVIGYDGETAVVHGQQRRRYGKLTTTQLLDRGLYKAAFCSADHAAQTEAAGAAEELEMVRATVEQVTGRPHTVADLRKLFGVFGVPAGIKRIIVA